MEIHARANRFRLFFRAHSRAEVILYAWARDRDTLREAGAGTDPYAVFGRMLASGNPPDDWTVLMAAAPDARLRFSAAESHSVDPDDPATTG